MSSEDAQALLDLTRRTIRLALGAPDASLVPDDRPAFQQRAGAFVSLHVAGNHALRGCMGRLDASEPVGQVVAEMAEAVLRDPRFSDRRITLAELPDLEVELSLISPMEPASGPLDFDLLEHGIYLTIGEKSGVFLPQVARETQWSKEKLLSHLCSEKMGLGPDDWRNQGQLQRFTCQVIGPVRF